MTTEARAETTLGELGAELGRALAPYAPAARATHGDVARAARWLAEAELLGLRGFGVGMLVKDLRRIGPPVSAPAAREQATAAPGPTPTPPDPIGSVDAAGVPGPLTLAVAVARATAAASAHGIGLVGVRGVGALGVLGLAARDIALTGQIALIAAQAPAIVAPWGSSSPAIGTNPIAIAAPRHAADGESGPPLVADFATAPLTLAELRARAASGEALPPGAAVDADGAATLDAARVAAILPESLVGSLGGLLVELLAGVAVGGRDPGPDAAGRGALILAFDPARAGGAHAAADAARLAADWVGAGGHLPARFDRLADARDPATPLAVDADALAALRAAAATEPPR